MTKRDPAGPVFLWSKQKGEELDWSSIFAFWLPLFFMLVVIWKFNRDHTEVPRIFRFMFFAGILGFFGPFLIPSLGKSIWWLELPAVAHTKTIAAENGDRYSASLFLQRIQRYKAEGKFQNGWFVNAAGGGFSMGRTSDGSLAVASARLDRIEFFNPDGSYSRPPVDYGDDLSVSYFGDTLTPEDFEPIEVDLIKTSTVPNPGFSISTILLFPLASPFLGGFLIVLGVLGAWTGKPPSRWFPEK